MSSKLHLCVILLFLDSLVKDGILMGGEAENISLKIDQKIVQRTRHGTVWFHALYKKAGETAVTCTLAQGYH
jgi:hypothetical protein